MVAAPVGGERLVIGEARAEAGGVQWIDGRAGGVGGGTFHVNLPDARGGHVVLALADGRLRLETISYGLLPRG